MSRADFPRINSNESGFCFCGIALLPTYIVGGDLQQGTLRTVLPEYKAAETALYATYLPNRYLAAKVRVFVDYLVGRFGPAPGWDALRKMPAAGSRRAGDERPGAGSADAR